MKKTFVFLTIAMLFANILNATQKPVYQDNFYKAVNQEWIDAHPVPDDKSMVSSFSAIDDTINVQLLGYYKRLGEQKTLTPNERHLWNIYQSYVDMETRNAKGVSALRGELARIDALKDKKALARLIADLSVEDYKEHTSLLYEFSVQTDQKDATRYMIQGEQLRLPIARKYYLDNSKEAKEKKTHYRDYAAQLLTLAGFDNADQRAVHAMQIEKAVAKATWTGVQNNDAHQTYNPTDYASLIKTYPHLEMGYLFEKLGYPKDVPISIKQPSYFKTLDRLMGEFPIESWKDYLRSRILDNFATMLSEPFVQASLALQIKEGNTKSLVPIDKRTAEDMTYSTLRFMIGEAYVEHFFDKSIKPKIEKMVQRVLDEYRIAIQKSNRFTPQTKAYALKKMDTMVFSIAYPDKPKDYSRFHTKPDDLIYNHKQMIKLIRIWEQEKLKRKKVDRQEWLMGAQASNAYYTPYLNKFIVTAGILNAPFYDLNASEAENYGGIGLVIAHEIGHAFDSFGSQFDEVGNMRDWWSEEDKNRFKDLQKQLIVQANSYEILPGVHVNGALQINEILADLSGLEIALRAYLKTEEAQKGDNAKQIRHFFEHFAKTWKRHVRPEVIKAYNDGDTHPYGEYRVNGTLRNMDAFYKAFDVKKGDKMYLPPEKRVQIWPK